ncbi:hypothetical protein J5N97_027753 [Dioscorea zingiberensis]|uniref:CobW/HypB/UreG nucleotide-binding domain-containing protein n=1 Tax=Dioscorea zingiberensis TaxID=325984 RepID=A0A9D5BXF9_9LILI|nr:hypothetical protein J5N97_027753 [Dioscorea zingiberensis]
MEGNEMSVTFENLVFNRSSGLGGGRMACTLVTGFLGSGKTTLLRHVLDNRGDLRIAVLVNEFADSDVDSLLLDSTRINSAFNLSTVALTHGCACCDVKGPFREALQRIVDSKHNFDCLLIETSGLAQPDKFVPQLEEVGMHLDLIITVISDAEDILEKLTGCAKVVRSQFCKVPLDLVIDCSKIEALSLPEEGNNVLPILSHEALPKMKFQRNVFDNASVAVSALNDTGNQSSVSSDQSNTKNSGTGLSHGESFSSVTFQSEVPLSLAVFQSEILPRMSNSCGLLRAKGIIWFAEDRSTNHPPIISSDGGLAKEYARQFIKLISADGRFKEPSLEKEPLVIFGVKGSPLRGIKESQLSGALMRIVNGKGNIFPTWPQLLLKLLFDGTFNSQKAWDEVRYASSVVISKLCKNYCPCRSDLAAHVH